MNMKSILAGLFLSSTLFVSCKKELQPQESSETVVASETEVTSPENQSIEKQFEVQNPQANQAPNPVQTQPATTAPGMNPPHGQPNHRCDIAVGAPLSSPKAATPPPAATMQAPAPQGQASVTPVDMKSGTTATAPGMNPPHGQAGHSCSVAVGAPLPK